MQTGFGRTGKLFAVEHAGVEPDLIVLAKSLGGGLPLGAVVGRSELMDATNPGGLGGTFGGNQVSCAIGHTVLDVLHDEQLQNHALVVGQRLLNELGACSGRHELVGDVRGSGLFLGVELVRDRQSLEPADREASYVVNRMRDEGVLAGTDGPYHNVVKIRPPMPFDLANADRLVETFDRVLAEL